MLEKIALQKKLITEAQCKAALEACRGLPNRELALKEYFVSKNLIPLNQLKQLVITFHALKTMKKNALFGRIAVQQGFVANSVFQEEMARQKLAVGEKNRPRFIGELWLKSRTITMAQFRDVIRMSKKRAPASPMAPPGPVQPGTPACPPEDQPALAGLSQPPENHGKPGDHALTEPLPGGVVLEVDKEGMNAFFRKTDQFDKKTTPQMLMAHLFDHGIFFGVVNEKNILGFIRSGEFREKPFRAAAGTPPVKGRDARIEYYFDTDHLRAGGLDEEGNIDFRERGQVPRVEEGSLLVEKLPMKEALSGRNIFDQVLEVMPAVDIPLRFKSGVVLSQDELKLYAEISGHPRLTWSGNIQVTDTFVVKKDVDYKTGHLEYEGDIDVKGRLKAGFRIRGESVRIHTVDGGDIHAQGDVLVAGGVNDARIYARGNVSAKYIQNSTIHCLGNLFIEKEIVDCTIETSGAVRIQKGEVISSKVICNMGLYTRHLGTDKSVPNHITLGVDRFTAEEIKAIDQRIAGDEQKRQRLLDKKEALSREISESHAAASRLALELDQARREASTLSEQLENGNGDAAQIRQNKALMARLDRELNQYFDRTETKESRILDMEVELEQLEDEIEDRLYERANFIDWQKANPGIPAAVVTGRLSPGTLVSGPAASMEITEGRSNITIKEAMPSQDGDGPAIVIYGNTKSG